MPERKRIVRFEIVFSCIPFLLRLSQIVEPEPEPHPRPPRKVLEIGLRFSAFIRSAAPADKCRISKADDRGTSATKQKLFSSGKCRGFPGEGQPFDLAHQAASLCCCRILLAGAGLPFVGEVPLCEYVLENPRCFRIIYSSKVFPANPD